MIRKAFLPLVLLAGAAWLSCNRDPSAASRPEASGAAPAAAESVENPAPANAPPPKALTVGQIVAIAREADRLAKLGSSERERAAGLHEDIAIELRWQDRGQAIVHWTRAIELRRQLEQWDREAQDLNRRGLLWKIELELEKARADFELALEKATRAGNLWDQSNAINNLGMLRESKGDWRGARKLYLEALNRLEGIVEAGDSRVQMLMNVAQTYRLAGNFPEAQAFLERAVEVADQNRLPGKQGAVLMELALLEFLRGRPEAALDYLFEASDFLGSLDTTEQVGFYNRFSLALSDLGFHREAWQAGLKAVETAAEFDLPLQEAGSWSSLCRLSILHPEAVAGRLEASCERTGELTAAQGYPNRLAGAQYWLARHFWRLGQLKEAIDAGNLAIDQLDSLRERMTGLSDRSRFSEDRSPFFRSQVEMLMAAHLLEPGAGHDISALEVSERWRARQLVELWTQAEVDLLASADPGLRKDLQRELGDLERLRKRSGMEKDPQIELEIDRKLAEIDDLRQQLRHSSPSFGQIIAPSMIRVPDVQKLLGPDTAVAMLILGELHSHLFLIDHHHVRSHPLAPAKELEAAAKRFLDLVADPRALPHRPALWSAGYELNRLLWGEDGERLADLPERLVFIGDGVFQQFPLAALPLPGSPGELPHYLLEKFEIVHSPSLSLLEQLILRRGDRADTGARMLLLGDPFYQIETRSDIPLVPLDDDEVSRNFPGQSANLRLGRLPFADREAASIRARFGKIPIDVALGAQASRERFLAKAAHYSILHLASHGWRDPDHAELSALLLAEVDEKGNPVDGKLLLQDLYLMPPLKAELVVASACQTGIGGNLRLEGVGGLAQGFFHAGARRTLVSLWQVESESTAELMSRFYGYLLNGKPPGSALRYATLDLIDAARQEHRDWNAPYFWSAFVLIGDWNSFELPGSP